MKNLQPDLADLIEQCAGKYRQGREAEAAMAMQSFIQRFSELVAGTPDILTKRAEQSIAVALRYQETRDWIGLADELQYVLQPEIETKQN